MLIHDIYQGWKNLAFPKEEMKEFLQNLEDERLAICKECHYGEKEVTLTSRCHHCGCFLRAKARCTDCSCPLGKWIAVLTSEQDEHIQKILTNE
jgi:hypothetical protein